MTVPKPVKSLDGRLKVCTSTHSHQDHSLPPWLSARIDDIYYKPACLKGSASNTACDAKNSGRGRRSHHGIGGIAAPATSSGSNAGTGVTRIPIANFYRCWTAIPSRNSASAYTRWTTKKRIMLSSGLWKRGTGTLILRSGMSLLMLHVVVSLVLRER